MFIQIYTSPNPLKLLADWSGRAEGLSFSTNRHGFSALTVTLVPMSLPEAFAVYEWPGTPHVVVSDAGSGVAWEGRLEDIAIVPGGVSVTAFGYQRALTDVPYTALWSKTGSGGWRPVTQDDATAMYPDRYEMDNNNRLYIAPRDGETYSNMFNIGAFTYAAPHNGVISELSAFSCDYDLMLPADWQFRVQSRDDDFTNAGIETTVTATGSPQSGSLNLTSMAGQARLVVEIRNNTGGPSTIAAATGTNYLRLTNLRISGIPTPVVASSIVSALVSFVNSTNPGQLSGSKVDIETTTTDLMDEIYEDEYPDAILDRLALLHGYEWSVWDGQRLSFRPSSGQGRSWYVDVTEILDLQRSLDNVRNSAYAVYRAAGGRTMRTARIGNGDSMARYGVVRRGFVNVQSTSSTEAVLHRGAFLTDRAFHQTRARIAFDRVYDAAGSMRPLWAVRAGDTITMRNLPPTLSTDIDRIRTFTVGETDYDAERGELSLAPLVPTPSLVTLVAQR